MEDIRDMLKQEISKALEDLARDRGVAPELLPEVYLERPKRPDQGDWATNVALQGAKVFGGHPREVAQALAERLTPGEKSCVAAVEIAGPGFINFRLSRGWMGAVAERVFSEGERYGRSDLGRGRRVQVEFVSANPTGPLHVGHGRGAVVGDVMTSILEFTGWQVAREYYINDAGLQVDNLGRSVQSRYFELLGRGERAPFPEDGYHGDYVRDVAQGVVDQEGPRLLDLPLEETLPLFREYGCRTLLEVIRKDLEFFGVRFDVWFSEKSLYDNASVPGMIDHLRGRDFVYDQDGAVWFRATAFGDEKDRVLIRSNGAPTYFASDVAYHKDKFDRGFDLAIDVWGADHHGYIPRVRAAVEALGRDPQDFQVILIQMVNLLRHGEPVTMSKRSGQFVTLRDVLDDVGPDATRYFFLMRRSDSHLDFDLGVAKTQGADNPVYYVQYAHARMASIFREAEARGIPVPSGGDPLLTEAFGSPEEQALMRQIALFPDEVAKASREYEPHRLVFFAYDLACAFHSFYNASRILGEEPALRDARLVAVRASQIALANALRLLGIGAPERM